MSDWKNIFVDGTKIESAANKYTFVWKRAFEKNDKKNTKKQTCISEDFTCVETKKWQLNGDY